jgi:hypothetical protein
MSTGILSRALARAPQGVTAAPIKGTATQAVPIGQSTVLDGLMAARQKTLGDFEAVRANQGALLQQLGEAGYAKLLQEVQVKAETADAQFRQAAAQRGLGRFVE